MPPKTVVPRNMSTFFSSVNVALRNGRLSSTLPNTAAISDFIYQCAGTISFVPPKT